MVDFAGAVVVAGLVVVAEGTVVLTAGLVVTDPGTVVAGGLPWVAPVIFTN